MREKVVKLYKNEGETPLECLDRFRSENSLYQDAVLSYVGRLDPMAEGLLLVVVDEENKNREKYLHMDKTYEVDVLLGIKTDTGDMLGKVTGIQKFNQNTFGPCLREDDTPSIKGILDSFVGEFKQAYPAYSSKPVKGKSLFKWAREGKLDEIDMPEKISKIHSIDLVDEYSISPEVLVRLVEERIKKVKGDFRQEEIMASWKEATQDVVQPFKIIRIEVSSSSGTYMRSLAEAIGKKQRIPAIAWKIKRTYVGQFSISVS